MIKTSVCRATTFSVDGIKDVLNIEGIKDLLSFVGIKDLPGFTFLESSIS